MRVLIRVPEAYLLLARYEATRPGLLILDADARSVASIPLTGRDGPVAPADLSKQIGAARTAAPFERWLVRGTGTELTALGEAAETIVGVERVRRHGDDGLELQTRPGLLTTHAVLAAVGKGGAALAVENPVEVRCRALEGLEGPPSKPVAGIWHRSVKDGYRIWVPRLLLHPRGLAGTGAELTARTFEFVDLPKGASAVSLCRLPFAHPGVVAVFPDVFHDRIEVVGKQGAFDPEAVAKAFEAKGVQIVEDE